MSQISRRSVVLRLAVSCGACFIVRPTANAQSASVTFTLTYAGSDSFDLTVTDLNNGRAVLSPSPIRVTDGFSQTFTAQPSNGTAYADVYIETGTHSKPYEISLISPGDVKSIY